MEAGLPLRISESHSEFARSGLVVESNPEQTVALRVFETFQRLAGQSDGAVFLKSLTPRPSSFGTLSGCRAMAVTR